MKHTKQWIAGALIVAGLQLAACGQTTAPAATHAEPAKVEHIEGSELSRVILTAEAAKRLDIQTIQVQDKVVPYASVIYDLHGVTWAYTNPEPLTFVRHRIDVDRIEGDRAILTDGPPAGTAVVIVGAAELFGTELGVGH